jgi:hypothetical protein
VVEFVKTSWIAARTLTAVKPSGEEVSVTLRIGQPYEISSEEWACPVAIEGLQERLRDIHGIDSWQTIQLVQNLQAQLLGYFIEEGGKLYWPGTHECMELVELFPKAHSV